MVVPVLGHGCHANWTRKGGVYAFVSLFASANNTLGTQQKTIRPLAAVNYSIELMFNPVSEQWG